MSNQSESKFWKTLKWHIEKSGANVVLTRIENSQTPGIPDLLLCDEKKRLHLIELKVLRGNKVLLSPFQVSFATRHMGSKVWLLAQKWVKDTTELYLYRSERVLRVADKGVAEVKPDLLFTLPLDVDKFLKFLADS